MRAVLSAAAIGLLSAGPVWSQEVIRTENKNSETTAARTAPQDTADAKAERGEKTERRCTPMTDGERHGEVWVEGGTGGYGRIGGVVTQPLGDCAALTIGVDYTHGDDGYGTRRRSGRYR